MKMLNSFLLIVFSLFVADSYALSAVEVVDKVGKSVVYVLTFDDKKNIKTSKRKYGSGVAVKKNIIATNCHVARSGKYILVIKNKKASPAHIIGSNDDICLLYVHKMDFVPVRLRSASDVKVGEDVYAIGNPSAIENYLSRGIVSTISRQQGREKIYSDVTTAQGSSGGGLFDVNGNLIGITTAVNKKNSNISISIPVDWIASDLKIKTQTVSGLVDEDHHTDIKKPGIQLIGVYGDARIGLYKTKSGCFMFLPGQATSGLKTSAALWFPNDRKSLYLFPFAKNMNDVARIIKIQKSFLVAKNKKLALTKHKLIFNAKTYPVYVIGNKEFSDPVLYVRFEKNPTMRLAESDDFTLHLCDSDRCTKRFFTLWGFSDSLINYNAKCLNY